MDIVDIVDIIAATHHLHTLPRWVIANRCCRPFARRERLSQASLSDWLHSRAAAALLSWQLLLARLLQLERPQER